MKLYRLCNRNQRCKKSDCCYAVCQRTFNWDYKVVRVPAFSVGCDGYEIRDDYHNGDG